MKKIKVIGVASAMALAIAASPISSVFAAESGNSDLELQDKAGTLPSSIGFTTNDSDSNSITPYGSIGFKTDGSGSTKITATDTLSVVGVETANEVTPFGIPVSKVQAVGKTTSKVLLSTHGVALTFMRNGSSLGTKQDSGAGKSTDTATLSVSPGSVPSGTEYRATSHHTLSTSSITYIEDTADSLKF